MARRNPVLLTPRPAFPSDFPVRLERFKEESGLTWRVLARAVYVNPRRIHYWRHGTLPDAVHFYQLLTLAEQLNLRDVLMGQDQSSESEDSE